MRFLSFLGVAALWPLFASGAGIETATSPRVPGAGGAGASYLPATTPDGRFIAFVSSANNLVTNDDNLPYLDVFLRDRVSGRTVLVSVDRSGTGGGRGDSSYPAVSNDGRYVAFASSASNLVAQGTGGIFVRDVVAGTTQLANVSTNGGSAAIGRGGLQFSGDGRYILFPSSGVGLIPMANFRANHYFRRDLWSNVTVRVTERPGSPPDPSSQPFNYLATMTPDGGRVAFVGFMANLSDQPVSPNGDLFVRDLESGAVHWAGTNLASLFSGTLNYICRAPYLSDDGRFVLFGVSTSFLPELLLCRHDLETQETIVITNRAQFASYSFSANGQVAAFTVSNDLVIWKAPGNSLVSVYHTAKGEPASGTPMTPVISADGSRVVFLSDSTNLTTNSLNGELNLFEHNLITGNTHLLSATVAGGACRDSSGAVPSLSADGKVVAFDSPSAGLVPDDDNQASDVFVKSENSPTLELISARDPDRPGRTGSGFSSVSPNAFSADGRFLVFMSFDSNLVADDTNRWAELFVRDRQSTEARSQSLHPEDGFTIAGPPTSSQISGDGRFVAFTQTVTDSNGVPSMEVFRRDRKNNDVALVSITLEGGLSGGASNLSMSGDGMSIAFQSASMRLTTNKLTLNLDVFVRQLDGGETRLVSVTPSGAFAGQGNSINPVFSPDGHWIGFFSQASDLAPMNSPYHIFRAHLRDLLSSTTFRPNTNTDRLDPSVTDIDLRFSPDAKTVAVVGKLPFLRFPYFTLHDLPIGSNLLGVTSGERPSFSADGKWLLYSFLQSPFNPTRHYARMNLATFQTNVIPFGASTYGQPNMTSAVLSQDGRYALFTQSGGALLSADVAMWQDIFIYDFVDGSTTIANASYRNFLPGNGPSGPPVIAPNGRTVAFASMASDLVAGDFNGTRDIFILELGAGDSDGDGLPDDWELAYFGDLSRDGKGDFDGDGTSDLEEYRAGSDPTDRGSVFRVITLNSNGSDATTVLWNAIPGRRYQLQFTDEIDPAQWVNDPQSIVATSSTAATVVAAPLGSPRRFFRVVLIP